MDSAPEVDALIDALDEDNRITKEVLVKDKNLGPIFDATFRVEGLGFRV